MLTDIIKKQCLRFNLVQQCPVEGYVEITESLSKKALYREEDTSATYQLTLNQAKTIASFMALNKLAGSFVEKPKKGEDTLEMYTILGMTLYGAEVEPEAIEREEEGIDD